MAGADADGPARAVEVSFEVTRPAPNRTATAPPAQARSHACREPSARPLHVSTQE